MSSLEIVGHIFNFPVSSIITFIGKVRHLLDFFFSSHFAFFVFVLVFHMKVFTLVRFLTFSSSCPADHGPDRQPRFVYFFRLGPDRTDRRIQKTKVREIY